MRPRDLLWYSERLELAVEDFHQMRTPLDRRKQLAHVAKLRGRITEMVLASTAGREAQQALWVRKRALRVSADLLIARAGKVMGYA